VINGAFLLALGINSGHRVDSVHTQEPMIPFVITFVFGYSFVMLFVFHFNNLYKISVYLRIGQHFVQILKCLAYSVIGMCVVAFVVDGRLPADSRLVILYFFHLCLGGLIVGRILLFRNIFRLLAGRGFIRRRVLVLGTGSTAKKLASGLSRGNPYGLSVVGFLNSDRQKESTTRSDLPTLGSIDDIVIVVHEQRVHEIVIALDNISDQEFWDTFDRCKTTGALVLVAATEQFAVVPEHTYQETYGDVPVFGLMNSTPYLGAPWLRTSFDFLLALFGIILVLPLYILVAIAIKLDSRGSILFTQKRIGRDGKTFLFYKFRSMFVGSHLDKERESQLKEFINEGKNGNSNGNGNGGSTKIVDETKITRVGRFIRKTSIDELPQLFNVLRGDMSLIGPRPCLPYEWENYEPWHRRRMIVKPGCTGMWQVLARSQVGFREMVILDNFYVYNVSFHLDLWLLLKTIPVILFSMGGK
jgi:undecaprenyl-phosphate galactose phosphotransferase